MTSATHSYISPSWRFEASLAVTGLCDPPPFPGGPWLAEEANSFRACAAQLALAGGNGLSLGRDRCDEMEAALNELRPRLLRRDPESWPGLAPRPGCATPIEFSVLVGWGARSWFYRLDTHGNRAATLTQIAAVRVITAVDRAVADAVQGGEPACLNANLTRRIGTLRIALSNLLRQPSHHAALPGAVVTLVPPRHVSNDYAIKTARHLWQT